jgi:hypothetical protein
VVDSYSFGRIAISGKSYASDLIIYPDRIDPQWWRETGHYLSLVDIRNIFDENFEVLIVGTGYLGLMKVDEEVIRHAKSLGIEIIIEKTKKAVDEFNRICDRKKTIAAFHLTC